MAATFDKSKKSPEELVVKEKVPIVFKLGRFFYFMTNDYSVMVARLESFCCRAPLPWEFSPLPGIPGGLRKKMKSLGASWAVVSDIDVSYLLYYDDAAGAAFWVPLDILSRGGGEFSVRKMFRCIVENRSEEIEELAAAGFDINRCLNQDASPLGIAALVNSSASVQTLLSLGADVNARNDKGETPLMGAVMSGSFEAAKALLSDRNIDLEAKDISGITALNWAASLGDREMAGLLLASGADIDSTDAFSRTPLLGSLLAGKYDVAEFLIDSGADVNRADGNGVTALILMAMQDNATMTERLLKAGADPTARERHGHTALVLAACSDSALFIDAYLKNTDVSEFEFVQALSQSAEAGTLKATAALLRGKKSFDVAADVSRALPRAARYNAVDLIPLYLEYGCDINARYIFGMTALMVACYCRADDFARTLLDLGADVNVADNYGMTALMYAACKGNFVLATLLLENDADRDAKDKLGKGYEDYLGAVDSRSYDELADDRWQAVFDEIADSSSRPASIPPAGRTFGESFDYYRQRYFERFPGRKPSDIYKDGGISRKTFSKIMGNRNPDYRPKKDMVISLALGLRLSMPEAEDFLQSAGYRLSGKDKKDAVVKKMLSDGNYDKFDWSIQIYEATGLPFFHI